MLLFVDLSELVRLLVCDLRLRIDLCEREVPFAVAGAEGLPVLDELGVAEACVPMLLPSSWAAAIEGKAIAAAIMIKVFTVLLHVEAS